MSSYCLSKRSEHPSCLGGPARLAPPRHALSLALPLRLWLLLMDQDHSCPLGGFCLAASLVAQTVKNLPAMQETRVQSLGQKDPLEKEMASHSSILA